MKLYLKMAFLSAAISLVFSACERMSQSNLQSGQQTFAVQPATR